MATDYAEKERQFIASLEADTGLTLDAWMRAISDSGQANRNDTIDWLRERGFTFSNASWLERIHHNGGRLVYADDAPQPLSPAPPRPASTRTAAVALAAASASGPPPLPAVNATASLPRLAAPALVPQAMLDADVQHVLNAAKGLRPLAHLALQAIVQAVPHTAFSCDGELLILGGPRPYLAMLPGPKALRFYGMFGPEKHARVQKAETAMKIASKAAPPFAFVVVLDDARRVDGDFDALIRAAFAAAKG